MISRCGSVDWTDDMHTIPVALLIFHELAFTVAIIFLLSAREGDEDGYLAMHGL